MNDIISAFKNPDGSWNWLFIIIGAVLLLSIGGGGGGTDVALVMKFAELAKVEDAKRLPIEFDAAMIARLRADYSALGKEIDTIESTAKQVACDSKSARATIADAIERMGTDMLKSPNRYTDAQIITLLSKNDPNGDFEGLRRTDLLTILRDQFS